MKKILLAVVMIVALSMMVGGAAYALGTNQATSTLNVTAKVVGACAVITTPVNFGIVDGSADLNAVGSVVVKCSDTTAYNVALDKGSNSIFNSNKQSRNLSDGGLNFMAYELFSDNAGTVWGDSDALGSYMAGPSLSGNGTGFTQTIPVYATLYATSQVPSPGIYNDVVNVTLYY